MARKILVVDDEHETREFVSTVLEENGFVPLVAKNGEEAMAMLRDTRPDLIILDVLMPMRSGIRLYQELKREEPLRDIPVLIFSGIARRTFLRTQAGREEAGGEATPPPDAYVEKPAKPERLAGAIKKILA